MNVETIRNVWIAWIAEHRGWIGGVWLYLWVGFGVGIGVLWRAHERGSFRARRWAWGAQCLPILGVVYGFVYPRKMRSEFGVGERLPYGRRSFRWGWGLWVGGLVPGGAHLLMGRVGRAIGYWVLMGCAAILFAFQRADVRGSWKVSLERWGRNETVTVNFRVPKWLGQAMLFELGFLVPLTYFEALSGASVEIQKRVRRSFRGGGFYRLRVERPGVEPRESCVDREEFVVGSAETCDEVISEEEIDPRHVCFFVRWAPRTWSVEFRCFGERAKVFHNGSEKHEALLHPGDRVTVGGTTFLFLPLEESPRGS